MTSQATFSARSPAIRVFILDDDDTVRWGVSEMLNSEPDIEVVSEAETAAEALRVVGATRPDVAVLDLRLEEGSGIDVCRDIRSRHPEVACLILTSFADEKARSEASQAGAAGCVLKRIRSNGLADSIRRVAGNGANRADDGPALAQAADQ